MRDANASKGFARTSKHTYRKVGAAGLGQTFRSPDGPPNIPSPPSVRAVRHGAGPPRHEKCEEVSVEEFKDLIERSGFRFSPGEFNNLLKWYFRGEEKITLEEGPPRSPFTTPAGLPS